MRMTRPLALLLAATVLPSLAHSAPRLLTQTVPAAGLTRVTVSAGVGEVEVRAASGDEVRAEVVLEPRRGGLFSSIRAAEREVQEAVLTVSAADGELTLEVSTDSGDRRFEERWTLTLPASLALELRVGVGNVRLDGLAGGVTLESGVGNALLEVGGGDLEVELGVGDLTLVGPAAAYGPVTCSSGVGETRLRVHGQRVEGGGFLGGSSSWTGQGPSRLEAEVGVGNAVVTLD